MAVGLWCKFPGASSWLLMQHCCHRVPAIPVKQACVLKCELVYYSVCQFSHCVALTQAACLVDSDRGSAPLPAVSIFAWCRCFAYSQEPEDPNKGSLQSMGMAERRPHLTCSTSASCAWHHQCTVLCPLQRRLCRVYAQILS